MNLQWFCGENALPRPLFHLSCVDGCFFPPLGFVADAGKAQSASKNGKRSDSGSSSFFTWFIVLALLGVWTSVAVVYFDLVDYQGVLGESTLTSALRSLYCDKTLPVSEL